jgi:hypothetical protein
LIIIKIALNIPSYFFLAFLTLELLIISGSLIYNYELNSNLELWFTLTAFAIITCTLSISRGGMYLIIEGLLLGVTLYGILPRFVEFLLLTMIAFKAFSPILINIIKLDTFVQSHSGFAFVAGGTVCLQLSRWGLGRV